MLPQKVAISFRRRRAEQPKSTFAVVSFQDVRHRCWCQRIRARRQRPGYRRSGFPSRSTTSEYSLALVLSHSPVRRSNLPMSQVRGRPVTPVYCSSSACHPTAANLFLPTSRPTGSLTSVTKVVAARPEDSSVAASHRRAWLQRRRQESRPQPTHLAARGCIVGRTGRVGRPLDVKTERCCIAAGCIALCCGARDSRGRLTSTQSNGCQGAKNTGCQNHRECREFLFSHCDGVD